jgi:hypothetical protein
MGNKVNNTRFTTAMISQSFTNPTPLVGVLNRLRRNFGQFKLGAHFL